MLPNPTAIGGGRPRVGGYDAGLLMGCLRHEAGPVPPRAGDVTLDSSKLAQALGHGPFDAWPSGGGGHRVREAVERRL